MVAGIMMGMIITNHPTQRDKLRKKEMKVIFVGVHNKPNTNPLCIFTKTGKLLQKVIDKCPKIEFVKSNLFDIDHFPTPDDDMGMLARDWWWRISLEPSDIIILLGAMTQKYFQRRKGWKTLRFGHPASVWSKEKQVDYVNKMVNEIETLTTPRKGIN